MKKKPVKFIYFDVGGVLLDFREGHRKVAEKYNVPYESIHAIFEAHWKEGCRGIIPNDVYMGMFAQLLGIRDPLPEFSDFWTDHSSPILESHALVHELRETYMMGILSNAEKNAMKHATRKGLIPNIEWGALIDSSAYGTIKPEAQIYEIAEQAVSVFPEEIFFIDDVPEHIRVAKSRGWQGLVFDTNNVKGSVEEIKRVLAVT